VTITTVGYGDRYPVTTGGRITAIFIMVTGVGIIGALASILSSVLVGSAPTPAEGEESSQQTTSIMAEELADVKNELISLQQSMEKMTAEFNRMQLNK
jgi:voltage-gated potassium channel